MNPQKQNQMKAGIVLMLTGAGAVLLTMAEGYHKIYVLLLFSAIFIGMYLTMKMYGYLIPGSLLLGLCLGLVFEKYRIPFWNPVLAGLGLGFVLIYLIDKKVVGKTHWWPLFPGLVLIFLNVVLQIVEWISKIPVIINYITQRPLLEYGMPLLIFLLGGYLVFLSLRGEKSVAPVITENLPVDGNSPAEVVQPIAENPPSNIETKTEG